MPLPHDWWPLISVHDRQSKFKSLVGVKHGARAVNQTRKQHRSLVPGKETWYNTLAAFTNLGRMVSILTVWTSKSNELVWHSVGASIAKVSVNVAYWRLQSLLIASKLR